MEFLLQKKLKYFDIPFVLNQGMKSASFHTKQWNLLKTSTLEKSKDFIEVVCLEKVEKLHL